ncbi:protein kinase family protein [Actinacidiphila sp. ITFR-21]|uniref:protein kinase family protein n=1 Tax=Actinacidiphila sp. ITFR-21 TaxID=3075199 RepID=UPI00288AC0F3|nr:protein kinase family protein [Streptomyces sp. ITFR-21]WNI16659.1 protein kinase family protein [Streptomyces sp. ITFR-21]
MADRSTAAVGVANEGGETQPAAQLSGATSGGTTTDDQTGSRPDAGAAEAAPEEQSTTIALTTAPRNNAQKATRKLSPASPGTPPTDTAPAGTSTNRDEDTGAPGASPEADTDVLVEDLDEDVDGAAEVAENGAGAKTPAVAPRAVPPELHSGHKLARRYQLAECVTRVDGFSSWRAVDEKLRRAVGIHILPAGHHRSRQVLAAARAAALLGDARFVQVLDAVEEDDLVYVIHEWLPDATSLADLLAAGPLEPHEAYQMVSQVSQGMAAAHREGLAHLRLDPGAVLRTVSGQYRIRGLAVAAALRGLSSEHPQRQDTEAMGALLYASLTQRWPYEEDAHGLAGLPKGVGLVAPDQVRAGIHRGLSEIAMRALVNDGATASREESPCTTPEELAQAVAGVPRIRPPEHGAPAYQPPLFQQPPPPPGGGGHAPLINSASPPPTLPGRTGQALKWAVAALLIVAIGLGSWQLADALQSRENQSGATPPSGQQAGQQSARPAAERLGIVGAKDFDPLGDGTETHADVGKVFDRNTATYWQTSWYTRADFGGLKSGVGVIVDLGKAHSVSSVSIDFIGQDTSVELMAASAGATTTPTQLDGFTKVAAGDGTKLVLKPRTQVTSRYLLVWLTKLPLTEDGRYRGKIAEISVTG